MGMNVSNLLMQLLTDTTGSVTRKRIQGANVASFRQVFDLSGMHRHNIALPAQLAGGVAVGSGLPSSPGTLGPSHGVPGAPRSIHVHIHTSDPRALIVVPSSSVSAPPRPFSFEEHVCVLAGGSGLSMRQLLEWGDPRNAAHGGARANHGSGSDRANRWSNNGGNGANPVAGSLSSGPSGMQGALMTFDENGAMRVVLVHSRGGGHGPSGNNGDPLLARF